MKEVHKTYNKFLSNPELMEAYEGRQRWLHDQATIREESFKEGEERGRDEEKAQTAKRLKAAGADMELIFTATGLSEEEIQKL